MAFGSLRPNVVTVVGRKGIAIARAVRGGEGAPMKETIIPINKPNLRTISRERRGEVAEYENTIRTYRSDPEGIIIQIRLDKGRLVSAWLPFIAARTLAQGILEALEP